MIKVLYAPLSINIILYANSKLGAMFQNSVLKKIIEDQFAI